MIAGLALIAAGALRAEDTPTPNAGKTGKHDVVQRILTKFDKNGDGALQADELAAFVAAHDKRAAETGQGKEVPPAPTAEKLMTKFDANSDGNLDRTELQAMLKELHAHHRTSQESPAAGSRHLVGQMVSEAAVRDRAAACRLRSLRQTIKLCESFPALHARSWWRYGYRSPAGSA